MTSSFHRYQYELHMKLSKFRTDEFGEYKASFTFFSPEKHTVGKLQFQIHLSPAY